MSSDLSANEMNAKMLSALVRTTVASNSLPLAESGDFKVKTLVSPKWSAEVEETGDRLAQLLALLMEHVGLESTGIADSEELELEETFKRVSEVNELLLDEVDSLLVGELKALVKKEVGDALSHRDVLGDRKKPPAFFAVAEINARSAVVVDDDEEFWSAAYAGLEFPAEQLQPPAQLRDMGPMPAISQRFTLVQDAASLGVMASKLAAENIKELAVDLEHHSWRSFRGLTCLMQLSTRREDFVVDVLNPEVRKGLRAVLEPLFADPRVVKVLHGADSDVLWLQRDLKMRIVNLFDTFLAARALAYPTKNLAYLLQRHASAVYRKTGNLLEEKRKFQLSDWRQRPLPPGMLDYARRDTHHLLDVYDRLRSELYAARGVPAIRQVLDQSKALSMRRYSPEVFDAKGWTSFLPQTLTASQKRCAERLWDFRDSTSRREDESTGYTLAGPVLAKLAIAQPTTKADVEKILGSRKQYAEAIAVLIATATEEAVFVEEEDNDASLASGPTVVTSPGMISMLRASASPFTFTPAVDAPPTEEAPPPPPPPPPPRHTMPLTAPSPVLSILELYQRAGWLTPKALRHDAPPLEEEEEAPAASASSSSASSPSLSSRGITATVCPTGQGEENFSARAAAIWAQIDAEHPISLEACSDDEDDDDEDLSRKSADAPMEEDKIPRSMSEIYAISNKNRKRNKARKKRRNGDNVEPVTTPCSSSNLPLDAESRATYFGGGDPAALSQSDSAEPPLKFMQSIGWVSATTPAE